MKCLVDSKDSERQKVKVWKIKENRNSIFSKEQLTRSLQTLFLLFSLIFINFQVFSENYQNDWETRPSCKCTILKFISMIRNLMVFFRVVSSLQFFSIKKRKNSIKLLITNLCSEKNIVKFQNKIEKLERRKNFKIFQCDNLIYFDDKSFKNALYFFCFFCI